MLAQAIKNALEATVTDAIGTAFSACVVDGCERRSPGVTCRSCKRQACLDHVYARVDSIMPPSGVVLCACCVASELEGVDRRRVRTRRGRAA